MDGVVADFDGYAEYVLRGSKDEHGAWPEKEWTKLRDVPNLYRYLPKMRHADRLITLARRFRDELGWNLYFLTAVPKNDDVHDAYQDKVLWVLDYYPDIKVRFGPHSWDKQKHCKPGDILVDDRTSNCAEWNNAGGIAIKVTKDYQVALSQLEQQLITQLAAV